MAENFIRKNGLLFSLDMKTIVGVDDATAEFAGKIPYGAKSINNDVFSECPYEFFIMPDSITHLGERILENSTALKQVKLPALLTKLPKYLFSGCSALTTITMPNAVEDFPEGLFQNCKSLKEIPFRAGLTVLHKNIFKGCSSLKTLVIPDSVKKIEAFAAADCTSLESVIFPPAIEFIDENAFFGCNALRTIRIDSENPFYYVNDDGNLCQRGNNGGKTIIKTVKNIEKNIKFFDGNLDDKDFDGQTISDLEKQGAFFLSEEEIFEDDDMFYSLEIGANSDELENFENEQNSVKNNIKESEEIKMIDENNANSMLADIMNTEKKNDSVSENVSVGTQELEVLSHTMSIMKDSSKTTAGSKVSNDELERLFAKNEENALSSQKPDNSNELDPKIQILVNSVEVGRILTFEPKEEPIEDCDLFVIAENLMTDAQGKPDFSPKLIACCKTFARIHDFKHVVLLKGLPFDNEEFLQFFHHFIVKKNLVLACSAVSPSGLSDYCKKVCEEGRISLNSDDLNEQRKKISIKTDTLIKLVIKDQC